ncbi:hypothetical protein H6A66_15290 [Bacteroides caecigallinarum]|uniref:hypothetical protein n=1 Tax=Bacteroides caecigallinarum TaxID=1411144 RepID=UPI00195BCAEC|nr:hypothetical protein [Bacteroides caecigallinarum]MBM6866514.1 hypothetical protein [Bacteroides caecigallinarum]
MGNIILSEKCGCHKIERGNTIYSTPLFSCCMIVMKMASGDVYAEHCGGSNIDTLSDIFFNSGDIDQAIMITSKESQYQIEQAHKLQLKVPVCYTKLYYYASDVDNGIVASITVGDDGSLKIENENSYHLVAY